MLGYLFFGVIGSAVSVFVSWLVILDVGSGKIRLTARNMILMVVTIGALFGVTGYCLAAAIHPSQEAEHGPGQNQAHVPTDTE